jgi:hypothetical protein
MQGILLSESTTSSLLPVGGVVAAKVHRQLAA